MNIPTEIIPMIAYAGAWAWTKMLEMDPIKSAAEGASQKFGENLFEKYIPAVKGWMWSENNWTEAADNYKKKVKERYGSTRVLGKTEQTSLIDMYVSLNILDKPSAYYDAEFSGKRYIQDEGLKYITKGKNSLLFGKPGAGKTTFFKQVALSAIEADFRKSKKHSSEITTLELHTGPVIDKVPIFLSLKNLAVALTQDYSNQSTKEILDFIQEEFEICNFPPDSKNFIELLLYKGNAIVLFDGLDEVPKKYRPNICNKIKNFVDKYSPSQYLISCRNQAEIPSLTLEKFIHVEIADFTESQVDNYARKYFNENKQLLDVFQSGLSEQRNEKIRGLARVPMLLSQICLAVERSGKFPSSRVDIYRKSINTLIEDWDIHRGISRDALLDGLDTEERKALVINVLASVAASNFNEVQNKNVKVNHFPVIKISSKISAIISELYQLPSKKINGELFLRTVQEQTGIINKIDDDTYAFLHLSVQEYLTALYYAGNNNLHKLLNQDQINNDQWKEIILDAAKITDDLGDFNTFVKQFQSVSHGFTANHLKVAKLLEYTNKQALETGCAQKNGTLRAYYLGLVIMHAHFVARYLSQVFARKLNIMHDFSRGRARYQNLAVAFSNALQSVYFFPSELDNLLNRAIYLKDDFDLILQLSREHVERLNLPSEGKAKVITDALLNILSGFADIVIVTKELPSSEEDFTGFYFTIKEEIFRLGEREIADEMSKIEMPPDLEDTWGDFSARLQAFIQNRRDIGYDWDFGVDDIKALISYCSANNLFIKCLTLLSSEDAKRIEENMFLPV